MLDVLHGQVHMVVDVVLQVVVDVMRNNVLDVMGNHMLDVVGYNVLNVMGHHMVHMVGIVHHLVVDDLGFGDLENNQSARQHQREQTQSHGLPGLQGNESQSQGNQHSGLQFQTQQEG